MTDKPNFRFMRNLGPARSTEPRFFRSGQSVADILATDGCIVWVNVYQTGKGKSRRAYRGHTAHPSRESAERWSVDGGA